MSTNRIRGGAGIGLAVLGLALLRVGPGFTESAAAPGCLDTPYCYAECEEQGTIGPGGRFISSYTATCRGDCNNGLEGEACVEVRSRNEDRSQTFYCSCNPKHGSAACSAFVTVGRNGRVESFVCRGDCGDAQCRESVYNVVVDRNCPTGYSLNRRCLCE